MKATYNVYGNHQILMNISKKGLTLASAESMKADLEVVGYEVTIEEEG